MYAVAVAFDMDIESLRNNFGDPYNNAYMEIRKLLEVHGFTWQQDSIYFGGDRINAVMDLSQKCRGSQHRFEIFACCASRN